MKDLGPANESGSHKGTQHKCPKSYMGEVTFDNGRFTECPLGCGFKVQKP